MAQRHRGFGAKASAAAVIAIAFSMMGTGIASAAAPPTTATVVAPDHATHITSGDQNTKFTLNLPPQASCSGDTAGKGYHVYSYAVLDSAINSNPAVLTYDPTNGPSQGFPLVIDGQSPYAAVNTAPNTGQIQQLPTFSFSLFTNADFPPGLYDIGIACTKPDATNSTDKFFNVQLQFAANPAAPTGFTWSVVPGNPTPESPFAIALPLSAVAVLGIAGFIAWRRRNEAATAAV